MTVSFGNPATSITEEIYKRHQKKMAKLLHFTAVDGDASIQLNELQSPAPITLEYSFTPGTASSWSTFNVDPTTPYVIPSGKSLYLRSKGSTSFSSSDGCYKFSMTGKIAAGGNIQYLIDSTGARTDVPEKCYSTMFFNCTSLIQAPELPATTLATECYAAMFYGCTSLTAAPELPATTLANGCYSYMFNECSSLTATPELPATTLANGCYSGMFCKCTSLTAAPELPATQLPYGCYNSMFQGCTSLIQAPELPATTLAQNCYCDMFNGCSNLKIAIAEPSVTGTTVLDLPSETQTYLDWNYKMFTGTGGTFADDPEVGTKYICYQ